MRIALMNWRDSTHPDGGGAEKYAETICAGLAARGHEVTFLCAAHGSAPATERVNGVRVRRQGGRFGVYAASLRALRELERTEGAFDVVVDVQNGVPFWARYATKSPVIIVNHHVHREQWPIVFGSVAARVGWLIESQVAPRAFRGLRYVTVSELSAAELAQLGVRREDITVIHNGTEPPLLADRPRAPEPRLVVLGRVVPHKRIEHAITVLHRLIGRFPTLRLRVVGDGWWSEEVRAEVVRQGLEASVDLLGHVDEETKHAELAAAWLALAPSIKEGWGLCVVEAASHGTPTIAYAGAGGLSESIVDGRTGFLVQDIDAMTDVVERLLLDPQERAYLGARAKEHAARFTWDQAVTQWEQLLRSVTNDAA